MTTAKTNRRRTIVAIAAIVAIVAVFAVRLVDVQVVQADTINRQAAEQRGDVSTLQGTRGSIVADDGTVLARTVLRYDFIATPRYAKASFDRTVDGKTTTVTFAEAVSEIAAITGQKPGDITGPILAALKKNKHSEYAPIVQGVDAAAYDKITALQIPWLNSTSYQDRIYPQGAVAGNLLGFLNGGGTAQAGLEAEYNACLAGQNGEETYQTSAGGVTIPGSTKVQRAAKNGGELVTTINPDLQWFAQQELSQVVPQLRAEFGMVSVVDIKTGQILTGAQYPSADPNNLGATSTNYWGAMMFQSQYEPGSIFKPITAAALIDAGKATPYTHVVVPDQINPEPGVSVGDAEDHPTEDLTLTGVLTASSNVGMSELATSLMSDQQRYDYYTKFGFGSDTSVDFPGQLNGILANPSQWDGQTRYATSFGQGVSFTQAQMLQAYQALANGGVKVPLSIVKGCKQADGTMTDVPSTKSTRIVSQKTSQEVLGMLENVLKGGPLSTLPDLEIPGYIVAAKTGTGQEPNGQGGYHDSFYVSVMGVAPVNDPQYLVSVNIGFPTTIKSSLAAGPLFKTMMSQVLKTYRVQPATGSQANYPNTY